MNKTETVEVVDTKDIKNILVQVDLEHNRTQILSNTSPMENLAYLMEAVGISIRECLDSGLENQDVLEAVDDYFKQIIGSFKK